MIVDFAYLNASAIGAIGVCINLFCVFHRVYVRYGPGVPNGKMQTPARGLVHAVSAAVYARFPVYALRAKLRRLRGLHSW